VKRKNQPPPVSHLGQFKVPAGKLHALHISGIIIVAHPYVVCQRLCKMAHFYPVKQVVLTTPAPSRGIMKKTGCPAKVLRKMSKYAATAQGLALKP